MVFFVHDPLISRGDRGLTTTYVTHLSDGTRNSKSRGCMEAQWCGFLSRLLTLGPLFEKKKWSGNL